MFLTLLIVLCMIVLISLLIFCAIIRNRNKDRSPVDMTTWLSGEMQQHAIEEVEKCNLWLHTNPLQKVRIIGRTNRSLVASYHMSTNTHRWVILIHGYTGHKEEMYHDARYFIKDGYNVLIPDLQGHGESDGRIIYFGVREHVDIFDWMDWIEEQDSKANIALFGVSMGAVAAMMAINRDDQQRIRCLIADSLYASPYRQVSNVMKMFHIKLQFFLPIVNLWIRLFSKFDLKKVETSVEINRLRLPVLFIMGTKDTYSPYDEQRVLYESCMCEKDLYEGVGAPHISSVYVDPVAYYTNIFNFLDKHFESVDLGEVIV